MSTTTLPLNDIDSIYLCRQHMHIVGQGEKSHVLMYVENDWIREQVLEDEVLANPKRVNVLEGSEGQPYLVFAYPYEDWDKIIKHLDASDNYDNISAEEFTEKGMQNKQRFRMECMPFERRRAIDNIGAAKEKQVFARTTRINYSAVVRRVAEGMDVEDALDDFQNEYFENRSGILYSKFNI